MTTSSFMRYRARKIVVKPSKLTAAEDAMAAAIEVQRMSCDCDQCLAQAALEALREA